ncbi:MAG: hypothetical protein HRU28_18310 [Rhizobiales bacterium]|nr:hypothetical protein [Hyphomicrobiales bacterium]
MGILKDLVHRQVDGSPQNGEFGLRKAGMPRDGAVELTLITIAATNVQLKSDKQSKSDKNKYQIYFHHMLELSASTIFKIDPKSFDLQFFIQEYSVELKPINTEGDCSVFLIKSLPESINGVTSVSKSYTSTLGVSAGVFGETPTMNVSASESETHSTGWNIQDCKVVNTSIPGDDPFGSWKFNFLDKL